MAGGGGALSHQQEPLLTGLRFYPLESDASDSLNSLHRFHDDCHLGGRVPDLGVDKKCCVLHRISIGDKGILHYCPRPQLDSRLGVTSRSFPPDEVSVVSSTADSLYRIGLH